MAHNHSEWIDFDKFLQPDAYMEEADTVDCPFDSNWQYGAQEGGQVARNNNHDTPIIWNGNPPFNDLSLNSTPQNNLGKQHAQGHLHTGADTDNNPDLQSYFHHGTMGLEYQGFASGGLEALTSNSTVYPEFLSSSSSGAYGHSTGNASDTMLMSKITAYEDQGSTTGAGAMTDNHTSSHDLSPSRSGSGPSSLSANNDVTNVCACISCFVKQQRNELWKPKSLEYNCVVGCPQQFDFWQAKQWLKHLQTHFKQDKKFHCRVPQCGQVFSRWGELTRHSKNHCIRPVKFACDVLGCKYGGDNGFIRHDKLLSHKRNVHDGRAPPSQLMRRLQAKPRA
ncbi:hypothetical protein MMC22_010853 [Lobaria immixta]|nr:hypothetical protein [Lobaria immixta]